eukprot:TRINITY_DN1777_c0_g1_i1.p1 TRINITY_DN1777_c0_g1~~TRINITY_DN1777_c0_g1_i1.p1  ORF type:complete len:273 (+),score=50.69 TRINITY_DN1777_c0_g1_i1:188-1006(+)
MSRFLGYAWAPVIAAFIWFATLVALIAWWGGEGAPRYRGQTATIVYISDTGAEHKALFVAGASVTAVFYVISLIVERYLRHEARLPKAKRTVEKVMAGLAIVFGTIGAIGLVLLTIFDVFNHGTAHWILTIVFVLGVAISAIFQFIEIVLLKKDHPLRKHLKRNATIKLVLVLLAILFVIIFAILYGVCRGDAYRDNCDPVISAAAVIEWIVAFIFDAYLITLVLDLYPAIKTSVGYGKRHPEAKAHNEMKDIEQGKTTVNQPSASVVPASR